MRVAVMSDWGEGTAAFLPKRSPKFSGNCNRAASVAESRSWVQPDIQCVEAAERDTGVKVQLLVQYFYVEPAQELREELHKLHLRQQMTDAKMQARRERHIGVLRPRGIEFHWFCKDLGIAVGAADEKKNILPFFHRMAMPLEILGDNTNHIRRHRDKALQFHYYVENIVGSTADIIANVRMLRQRHGAQCHRATGRIVASQ